MKRSFTVMLIGLSIAVIAIPGEAHDRNDNTGPGTYSWLGWRGVGEQINHLNRMVGHVRWQLTRYRANAFIRRDFARIRTEVDRVNWQYRRGDYDHRALRRQIEQLHARLHQLEVRLRVRNGDYYNWR